MAFTRVGRVSREGGDGLRAASKIRSDGRGLLGGWTGARMEQALQALQAARLGIAGEWAAGRGAELHPRGFHGRFQSNGGEKPGVWASRAASGVGRAFGGVTRAAGGGGGRQEAQLIPGRGQLAPAASVMRGGEKDLRKAGTQVGRPQLTQHIPMHEQLMGYVPTTITRTLHNADGSIAQDATGNPIVNEHYSMTKPARKQVEGILHRAGYDLATNMPRKPRQPSKGFTSRKKAVEHLAEVGAKNDKKLTKDQKESIHAVTSGGKIDGGLMAGHDRLAEMQRSVADPNADSHKEWYLAHGADPNAPNALEHMHQYSPDAVHMEQAMTPTDHAYVVQGYMPPEWVGVNPHDPASWGRVDEMNGWVVSDPTFQITRIGSPYTAQEMAANGHEGPFLRYSLVVPKGTPAVIPGGGSDKVILNHDTPYRITKVTTEPDGSKTLWGVVVPHQRPAGVEGPLGIGHGMVGNRGPTMGPGGRPGVLRGIRGEAYKPGVKMGTGRTPRSAMTSEQRAEDTRIRQAMSGLGWRKAPGTGAGTGKEARYMTSGRGMGGRQAMTDQQMLRPNWNPEKGDWSGKGTGSYMQHLMDHNDPNLAKMLRPGGAGKEAETFQSVKPEELVQRLQAHDALLRGVPHPREARFQAASQAARGAETRGAQAEKAVAVPKDNKVMQAWQQARGQSKSGTVWIDDLRKAPAMQGLSRDKQDKEITKALDAGYFHGSSATSANLGNQLNSANKNAELKLASGERVHLLRPAGFQPPSERASLGPGHNLGPGTEAGRTARVVRVAGTKPAPLAPIQDRKALEGFQRAGLAKAGTYVQHTDANGNNRIGKITAMDEKTGHATVQWSRMPRELFQGPSSRRPSEVQTEKGVDLHDTKYKQLEAQQTDRGLHTLRRFPYEVSADRKSVKYTDITGRVHEGKVLKEDKAGKATVEWRAYPKPETLTDQGRVHGRMFEGTYTEPGVDVTHPNFTLGKEVQRYRNNDTGKWVYQVGAHRTSVGGRVLPSRRPKEQAAATMAEREAKLSDQQIAQREADRARIRQLLGREEQLKSADQQLNEAKLGQQFIGGHEGQKPSRGDIVFDTMPQGRQEKMTANEQLLGREGHGGQELSKSRMGEIIKIGTPQGHETHTVTVPKPGGKPGETVQQRIKLNEGDVAVRWLDGKGEEVIPAAKYNEVGRTTDGRPHLQYRFLTKDDWNSQHRAAQKELQSQREQKYLRERGQAFVPPERSGPRGYEKPEERQAQTDLVLKHLDEQASKSDEEFNKQFGDLLAGNRESRGETVPLTSRPGEGEGQGAVRVVSDTMSAGRIRAHGAQQLTEARSAARVLRGEGPPRTEVKNPEKQRQSIREALRQGAARLLGRGQKQVEAKVEAAKTATRSGQLHDQVARSDQVMAGGEQLKQYVRDLRAADPSEWERLLTFKGTQGKYTLKEPFNALAKEMGVPTMRLNARGEEMKTKSKTQTEIKADIIKMLHEERQAQAEVKPVVTRGRGAKGAAAAVREPEKAVREPERVVTAPKPTVPTPTQAVPPKVEQPAVKVTQAAERPLAGKALNDRAAHLMIPGRSSMTAQAKRDAIAAEEKRLGIKPGEPRPTPEAVKVTRAAAKAAPVGKAAPAKVVRAAAPAKAVPTPAKTVRAPAKTVPTKLAGPALHQRAAELGIPGRSKMTAEEKRAAIAEHEARQAPLASAIRMTAEERAAKEARYAEQMGSWTSGNTKLDQALRQAGLTIPEGKLRTVTGNAGKALTSGRSPEEVASRLEKAPRLSREERDQARILAGMVRMSHREEVLARGGRIFPEGRPQVTREGRAATREERAAARTAEVATREKPLEGTILSGPEHGHGPGLLQGSRQVQTQDVQHGWHIYGYRDATKPGIFGPVPNKNVDESRLVPVEVVAKRVNKDGSVMIRGHEAGPAGVPGEKLLSSRVAQDATWHTHQPAIFRGENPNVIQGEFREGHAAERAAAQETKAAGRTVRAPVAAAEKAAPAAPAARVIRPVKSGEDVIANRGTIIRSPEHPNYDVIQHSGNKRWYVLNQNGEIHRDAGGRIMSFQSSEAATRRLDRIETPVKGAEAKVAEAKPTEVVPKAGRGETARVAATYEKYGLHENPAARSEVEKLTSPQRISYYAARRSLDAKAGSPQHDAAMARVRERYGLQQETKAAEAPVKAAETKGFNPEGEVHQGNLNRANLYMADGHTPKETQAAVRAARVGSEDLGTLKNPEAEQRRQESIASLAHIEKLLGTRRGQAEVRAAKEPEAKVAEPKPGVTRAATRAETKAAQRAEQQVQRDIGTGHIPTPEQHQAETHALHELQNGSRATEDLHAAGVQDHTIQSLEKQGLIHEGLTTDARSGYRLSPAGEHELTQRLRPTSAEARAATPPREQPLRERVAPGQMKYLETLTQKQLDHTSKAYGLTPGIGTREEQISAIRQAEQVRHLSEAEQIVHAANADTRAAERGAEKVAVTRASDLPTRAADKQMFQSLSHEDQQRLVQQVRDLRTQENPARPGKNHTQATAWAQVLKDERAKGTIPAASAMTGTLHTRLTTVDAIGGKPGEKAVTGEAAFSSLGKYFGQMREGGLGVQIHQLKINTAPGESFTIQHGTAFKRNGGIYLVEHAPNAASKAEAQHWVESASGRNALLSERGKELLHTHILSQGPSPSEALVRKLTNDKYGVVQAQTYIHSLHPEQGGAVAFFRGEVHPRGSGPNEHDLLYLHESWHLLAPESGITRGVERHGMIEQMPSREAEHAFTSHGPDTARWHDYRFVPMSGSPRATAFRDTLASEGTMHRDQPIPHASTPYGASSWAEAISEDGAFYSKGPIGRWVPKDERSGLKPMDAYYRDVYPERAHMFDQAAPDVRDRQLAALRDRAGTVPVPRAVERVARPAAGEAGFRRAVPAASVTPGVRGLGPMRQAALEKAVATGAKEGTHEDLGLTPGEASQLARKDVGVLERTGIRDGKTTFAVNEEHAAVRAAREAAKPAATERKAAREAGAAKKVTAPAKAAERAAPAKAARITKAGTPKAEAAKAERAVPEKAPRVAKAPAAKAAAPAKVAQETKQAEKAPRVSKAVPTRVAAPAKAVPEAKATKATERPMRVVESTPRPTGMERAALEQKIGERSPAQRVALRQLRALAENPANAERQGFHREEFAGKRTNIDNLQKNGLIEHVGKDAQGRDLFRPTGTVAPRAGAVKPSRVGTEAAPRPTITRAGVKPFTEAPLNSKDKSRFGKLSEEQQAAVREDARALHGTPHPSRNGPYTSAAAWTKALNDHLEAHPLPEPAKPEKKLTSEEKVQRQLDALAESKVPAMVPRGALHTMEPSTPVQSILGDSKSAQRAAQELDKGFSVKTVGDLTHLYPAKYVDDSHGVPHAIYPASTEIRQDTIRRAVAQALDMQRVEDPLPAHLAKSAENPHGYMPLQEALRAIHNPQSHEQLAEAQRRLKWDEAFHSQVALAERRAAAAQVPTTPRPLRPNGLLATFDRQLEQKGFKLTPSQREVGQEISRDLGQDHPMRRLLQGDVGTGKTIPAVRAALQTADNGGQTVIMAPTEALAQQHYRGVVRDLGPLGPGMEGMKEAKNAVGVVMLTGSQTAEERRKALEDIQSGKAKIIIGTTAVLGDKVKYHDLGTVIADEEHRFGVAQREELSRRLAGENPPHFMSMTATPIPRTVAMTAFGDMDRSKLIDKPSQQTIFTHVVSEENPQHMAEMYGRIRQDVANGHQAYMVFPQINGGKTEEKDLQQLADYAEGKADAKRPPRALLEQAPGLKEGELKGLRIGILHGGMPADEKERVLREFSDPKNPKYDVLLSTTVVEVGVDVPNSTTMSIFDADRFGAAQLHQLRGRVGRGGFDGHTYFISDAKEGTSAHTRLSDIAKTLDGERVAEMDLQNRRPGELFSTEQSGRSQRQRLLDLGKDGELIAQAHTEARQLLHSDPTLAQHPELARAVQAMHANPDLARYPHLGQELPQTPAGERGRVAQAIAGGTQRTIARRAAAVESHGFEQQRFGQNAGIDQEIRGRLASSPENLARYDRFRAVEEAKRTGVPTTAQALSPDEHRLLSQALQAKVMQPYEREVNSQGGRLEHMDLTDREMTTMLNAADLGARAQRARPPDESIVRGINARYNPQIRRAKGNDSLLGALADAKQAEIAAHQADQAKREEISGERLSAIEQAQAEMKAARAAGETERAAAARARVEQLTSTPATRQLAREQAAETSAAQRQHVAERYMQGTQMARRQVAEGRAGFKITKQGRVSPNDRTGDWERQQRAIEAFQTAAHNPEVQGDQGLRDWVRSTENLLTGGPRSELPVRPGGEHQFDQGVPKSTLYKQIEQTAQLHENLAQARARVLTAPGLDQQSKQEVARDVQGLLNDAQFFHGVRQALAGSQEPGHAAERAAQQQAREDQIFKQHVDEVGPEKAAHYLDQQQAKVDALKELQQHGSPEEIAANREVMTHASTIEQKVPGEKEPRRIFPEDTYQYKTINGETRSVPVKQNISPEDYHQLAPAVLDDLIQRRQDQVDHQRDLIQQRFAVGEGDTVVRGGRVRSTGIVRGIAENGDLHVQFGRNKKLTQVGRNDVQLVRKGNVESDTKQLQQGLGDAHLAQVTAQALDSAKKDEFRAGQLKAAQLQREAERAASVPKPGQHLEFSHVTALGKDGGTRHGEVVGPGPKYGKRQMVWVRVTDRAGGHLSQQEQSDLQKVQTHNDLMRSQERVLGTKMSLGDIAATPHDAQVPQSRLDALAEKGALQRTIDANGNVHGYFVPEDKQYRLVEQTAAGKLVSSDVPHSATGVRMRQYNDTPPEAVLHPEVPPTTMPAASVMRGEPAAAGEAKAAERAAGAEAKQAEKAAAEAVPATKAAANFKPEEIQAKLAAAANEQEGHAALAGLKRDQLERLATRTGYLSNTNDTPQDLRNGIVYRAVTRRLTQAAAVPARQGPALPEPRSMTRASLEQEIQRTVAHDGGLPVDLKDLESGQLRDVVSAARQQRSPVLQAQVARMTVHSALQGQRRTNPEHQAAFNDIMKRSGFDASTMSVPATRRAFGNAQHLYTTEANGKNNPEEAIARLRTTAASLRSEAKTAEGIDRMLPAQGRNKELSGQERYQRVMRDALSLDSLAHAMEQHGAQPAAAEAKPHIAPVPAAERAAATAAEHGAVDVGKLAGDNHLRFTPEETQALQERVASGESLTSIANSLEKDAQQRTIKLMQSPELHREGGPNSAAFDQQREEARARYQMAQLLRSENEKQATRQAILQAFQPHGEKIGPGTVKPAAPEAKPPASVPAPKPATPQEEIQRALLPSPSESKNLGAGNMLPGPMSPFRGRDRAWFERQTPEQQQVLRNRVNTLSQTKHPTENRNYNHEEAWRVAIKEAKDAAAKKEEEAKKREGANKKGGPNRRGGRGRGPRVGQWMQNAGMLGYLASGLLRGFHLPKTTSGSGTTPKVPALTMPKMPTVPKPITSAGVARAPIARAVSTPRAVSKATGPAALAAKAAITFPGSSIKPGSSRVVTVASKVVGGGQAAVPGAGAGVLGRSTGTQVLEPRLEGLLDTLHYQSPQALVDRLSGHDIAAHDINAIASRAGVSGALIGTTGQSRRMALANALHAKFGNSPAAVHNVPAGSATGRAVRVATSGNGVQATSVDHQVAAAKNQLAFGKASVAQAKASGVKVGRSSSMRTAGQNAAANVSAAQSRLNQLSKSNLGKSSVDHVPSNGLAPKGSTGLPHGSAVPGGAVSGGRSSALAAGHGAAQGKGGTLHVAGAENLAKSSTIRVPAASNPQGTSGATSSSTGGAVGGRGSKIVLTTAKGPSDRSRGGGGAGGGGKGGAGKGGAAKSGATAQKHHGAGGGQPRLVSVHAPGGGGGGGGSGAPRGGGLAPSAGDMLAAAQSGGPNIVSAAQLHDLLAQMAPADRAVYLQTLLSKNEITTAGLEALAKSFGVTTNGKEDAEQLIELISASS